MVIIEKEGIVIQISSFSDGIRIALLNTRGFLVEYASKLAKLAKEKGCNIAIVVDWDVSGLLIYLKVKKIIPSLKRVGVDFRTLVRILDLSTYAMGTRSLFSVSSGYHTTTSYIHSY
jgi:5S rRNA maturation endonuclease (ribonuclease M5)